MWTSQPGAEAWAVAPRALSSGDLQPTQVNYKTDGGAASVADGQQRAAGWRQVGARGSVAPSQKEMRQGRRGLTTGVGSGGASTHRPRVHDLLPVVRGGSFNTRAGRRPWRPQRAAEAMHAGDCGRGSILARRRDPCGVVSRHTLAAHCARACTEDGAKHLYALRGHDGTTSTPTAGRQAGVAGAEDSTQHAARSSARSPGRSLLCAAVAAGDAALLYFCAIEKRRPESPVKQAWPGPGRPFGPRPPQGTAASRLAGWAGPPARAHLAKLCPRGLGALLAVVLESHAPLPSLPPRCRPTSSPHLPTILDRTAQQHLSPCCVLVFRRRSPGPPRRLALSFRSAPHDRPRAHALLVRCALQFRFLRAPAIDASAAAHPPQPASCHPRPARFACAPSPSTRNKRANRPLLCVRRHPDQATPTPRRNRAPKPLFGSTARWRPTRVNAVDRCRGTASSPRDPRNRPSENAGIGLLDD
jgi:hypothetical protein